MSANVNENLVSAEELPDHPAEPPQPLLATQPRSAMRRISSQAFSRFVAAGPWSALAYRDFRLLWSGLLISQAGSQMRIIAVAWQVFLLSHSAFQIGALGLFQAIPTMAFSLVGGVIADAFDRRKLLLFTEITLACCSVALALLTIFNLITVPIIYVIAFISAAVGSFDYPTRQSLIPKMVPNHQLTNAFSLNILMFNLSIIVGPTLGGLAIAGLGVAGTYWFDVASFGCVVVALLLMRVDARPAEGHAAPGLKAMGEGMSFLGKHPVILSVMLLDFCAMFFGMTRSLLPIYAANIYHVGAQGLGFLLAATGVGAVLAAFLAGPIGRWRRQGLGILISIVVYGACILLFGLSTWSFALGLFFLAAAGAADMISTVLRSAIVQLGTPDDFRGRVSSANAVFSIGGPMLGQLRRARLPISPARPSPPSSGVWSSWAVQASLPSWSHRLAVCPPKGRD